jgi:hypothetical protein
MEISLKENLGSRGSHSELLRLLPSMQPCVTPRMLFFLFLYSGRGVPVIIEAGAKSTANAVIRN